MISDSPYKNIFFPYKNSDKEGRGSSDVIIGCSLRMFKCFFIFLNIFFLVFLQVLSVYRFAYILFAFNITNCSKFLGERHPGCELFIIRTVHLKFGSWQNFYN